MARTFRNPILPGFHADPSICRVEEDYYLVTSTFHYFPGVPIFHSRDLVHWTQIGHVLDRPSQLPLAHAGPSGGIFAPTIRYHDGTFYMITTNVSGGGNFIVTATDPAGPWSEPIWLRDAPHIDPSLLFDDDGRCYYVGNGEPEKPLFEGHRNIWMQEVDRTTLQLIGSPTVLIDGGVDRSTNPEWIEGPHLYKRNGFYYLLAAEGGTFQGHSEVIFRSTSPFGPYEPIPLRYVSNGDRAPRNPVLTNRNLDPKRDLAITCTGHVDFVETQNGEWWAVALACRPYEDGDFGGFYNTGRETFLMPIEWVDDWPILRDGSQEVKYVYPVPNLPQSDVSPNAYPHGNFHLRDDFDTEQLAFQWSQIRTSGDDWYSLTQSPGSLTLTCRPDTLVGMGNPSFLGMRQSHLNFTASVELTLVSPLEEGAGEVVSPLEEGDSAGIAITQNARSYYAIAASTSAQGISVKLLKNAHDAESPETRGEVDLPSGPVELKITAEGARYAFACRAVNGDWQSLGDNEDGKILATSVAGGFVGAYIGPYAQSTAANSKGIARFDWFEYIGNDRVFQDDFDIS